MHESSSGVLITLALLMIGPPSTGGSGANKTDRSRRSALVHSSIPIFALAGTNAATCDVNELHSLVEIQVDGAVDVIPR